MARKASFSRPERQLQAGERMSMVSRKASQPGLEGPRQRISSLRSQGVANQREISAAVRESGGRGSKAVEEARDIAQKRMAMKNPSGAGEFTSRNPSPSGLASMSKRAAGQLIKGALRGMLSPAGLAEGVAGSVAKLSDKAGHQKLQQTMHAKDKVKMPTPQKPGKTRA